MRNSVTEPYPGAPECSLPDPVSRAIDIWSLGCVFSIAATWVVFGFQGIRQFDIVREMAITKLIQQQRSHRSSQTSEVQLTEGDRFHDGERVLDDVLLWHRLLRNSLRKTDMVTSKVLDLVDQKMLKADPSHRIEAKDLCKELKEILHGCEDEPPVSVPTSILDALLRADNEAVSQPGYSFEVTQLPSRFNQQDPRKVMMKTAHRSTLTSTRAAQGPLPSAGRRHPLALRQGGSMHTPPGRPSDNSFLPQEPLRRNTTATSRTTDSSIGSPPIPPTSPSEARETQNVFQVHEEMERQQRSRLSIFPKRKMNEFLGRYFRNRDIVSLLQPLEMKHILDTDLDCRYFLWIMQNRWILSGAKSSMSLRRLS
jgi:serine/threonine protein kinase